MSSRHTCRCFRLGQFWEDCRTTRTLSVWSMPKGAFCPFWTMRHDLPVWIAGTRTEPEPYIEMITVIKKVSWRRLWSPRPRTRPLYQKSSKAMATMPGQAANLPGFFLSWRLFFWEMFSWQDDQEQDGRLGISVLEQLKPQLAWVEIAEVRWSLELSSLASRPDAWWAHLNTLMRWPILWQEQQFHRS